MVLAAAEGVEATRVVGCGNAGDAWAERAQRPRSPQRRRKTWAESTMLSDRSLDGASTKKWDSSSEALVHFWPIDLSAATLFSKLYIMYILVNF